MTEHQVPRRAVEAARRAIEGRDQLRLGELLSKLEISSAELANLAADLDCSPRSLRYAIATHRVVERFGLTEADVRRIGWTNLALVASRETDVGSKEDILRLCAGRTAAETRALLAGGSGSERQIVFTLSKSHRRKLEAALIRHGARRVGRALIGKEAALMAIIGQSG